ncbi:MAG: DoxX family membrane protein [Bryobacteraceae bacterium]|jgi:uncharacterized membrane protein YphA (DoxX/SURF4 family)
MTALPLIGRIFFVIAMVAFGIQNLYYTGFLKGMELTPEWAPWHAFWAYLDGVILVAGGISIAIQVKARLSAMAIGILFFCTVILLRLPRIGIALHDIGERTVLFEPLTIGCAAFLLAGVMAQAARIVIGISMIVFGIAHFQIPKFIASLIPSWIPGALFFAWLTGLVLVLAGLCIITRWQIRLASALLGLMFFLWVLVLHGPRVVSLHNQNEWNSLFVALAFCGLCWILTGAPAKE